MRHLFAAMSGGLFGTGLWLSGMTDTIRVQGWLDLFGAWDPTLAFVLGGAILPMALAWRIAAGRQKAFLGGNLPARPAPVLDRRLLGGSALFGVGWALVGLCPGPAMTSLTYGGVQGLVFFSAMALGLWAAPRLLPGRQGLA